MNINEIVSMCINQYINEDMTDRGYSDYASRKMRKRPAKNLSKLVIKHIKDGVFEDVKVIKNDQDKLVRKYNLIKKDYESNGWVSSKMKEPLLNNTTTLIMISTTTPEVIQMYIKTDEYDKDINVFNCQTVFDFLTERRINAAYYGIYPRNDLRCKRPYNVYTNWDMINNKSPKPYNKEKIKREDRY